MWYEYVKKIIEESVKIIMEWEIPGKQKVTKP